MNRYQHACYHNAKSLLGASKLLFEKRIYGHASSLAVLAIEECGKGFLLMFDRPKKVNESYFRNQIRSHKNKLKVAAKDAFISGLREEGFFSAKNPIKSLEDFQKKINRFVSEGNKKFLKMSLGAYIINELEPIKENGFYVDFKNGEIISPKLVKRKQAQFIIEQAERVVKYFPKTHGRKISN